MATASNHITELQQSLNYQQSLFENTKKNGGTFEQLKRIFSRMKEIESNIHLLRLRSRQNMQ
jgi:hypothetical protein